MSVFDVLGAAATIVQFIEIGIKVTNKTIDIYNGQHQFSELLSLTQDFDEENQNFMQSLRLQSTGPGSAEELLLKTAKRCQQSANELIQLINQISMKEGEKQKRKAFRSALKTKWREKDVLTKREELEQHRSHLHGQLIMIMSKRQYSLAHTLMRIEDSQASSGSKLARHLLDLKGEVISAAQSATLQNDGEFVEKLRTAQKLATVDLPRETILASLRYSEMEYRQRSITPHVHAAYDWIFKEQNAGQQVRYTSWLNKGDGIFWVTGKIGSGKSTLMKHIYNDKRTESALERWANGRKLLRASHYFWSAGTKKQRSYKGLLMSILYKILHACPDLVEPVCQLRWHDELRGLDTSSMAWQDDDLRKCLDKLVTSDLKSEGRAICFCFFIDGLDEYEGDYEVVDTLVRLARSGHTKICASSRPWNTFENAFSGSRSAGNYLILHQHTRDDIKRFILGELRLALRELRRVHEDWMPLIEEVVDRSEGVFLWVALVTVGELRPMLTNKEHISSVKKRLNSIPDDLVQYFQQIFDRICANKLYKEETARIFKSCIAAGGPLPIAAKEVMISTTPDIEAIEASIDEGFQWDEAGYVAEMRSQINGRCQDLLTVVGPPIFPQADSATAQHSKELYAIGFVHRSVRDFLLQSREVCVKLDELTGPGFDVNLTLLACYIALLKKAMSLSNSHGDLGKSMTIAWSTEVLLHLHEVDCETQPSAAKLLHSLDQTMQTICPGKNQIHWSNVVSAGTNNPVSDQSTASNIAERGNRDLIGHLIEFNLIPYVRAALTTRSTKQGRPYLDYALRYDSHAAFRSDARQEHLSELSGDPAMVKLLLDLGCNVNEPVYIYGGRTVWDLYLAFLFDHNITGERHSKTTWLLIDSGAKPIKNCVVGTREQLTTNKYRDVTFRNRELTMKEILSAAFGEEAESMCERIAQNDVGRGWFAWPVWKRWQGTNTGWRVGLSREEKGDGFSMK